MGSGTNALYQLDSCEIVAIIIPSIVIAIAEKNGTGNQRSFGIERKRKKL